MHADHPVQRDGSSHTTIPSIFFLVICAHSRESAVRLFGEIKQNRSTADQHECTPITRHSATARRTRPSHQYLCWSSASICPNQRYRGSTYTTHQITHPKNTKRLN
jgi:hypothetical protein